jgi:outer membrane protein OmpA-like peptidoglycan-associated protein
MIGEIKHAIRFGLASTALFLFAGCAATQVNNDFSAQEENVVTYKLERSDNERVFVDDGGADEIRYVALQGELIRTSPEHPSVSAEVKISEFLPPIAMDFKAAETPELLDSFINKYAPSQLAFVAVQLLARPAIDARDWPAAVDTFNKYRDMFPDLHDRFASVISLLEDTEEGLVITNLGSGINTADGEYNPVVSADGRKIYFARDCGECNGGEEVFVSSKDDNGNWRIASRFGEPLISRGQEIPLGISSDGNTMTVYGNYAGSLGRGDIFFVEKSSEGWGELQHYPSPLNSGDFESNARYTADGITILFISDRPGGIGDYHQKNTFFNGNYAGNTDIYVYVFSPEGRSEVINLGPVVNTPFSEYSPYLHPDGKTLYFSSNGHAGLGGLDVFKVTRLHENSWTAWSEPVNLGKEVNTSSDDWGYQATAGDKAYFAKSTLFNSFGSSDIFLISLPEKAKPSGVVTITGVVTDPHGDPLVAEVRWVDLQVQMEVGAATSDPITGKYILQLPPGLNYAYYAEKPGYIGESEHFDLRGDTESDKEYILDIVLYPIGQPAVMISQSVEAVEAVDIKMNNIFFAFDKSDLQPESYMEMQRWIRMLNENGHVKLEVNGHTDSIGTEPYNQKLSERRAKSVVNYLVDNGIARQRLVAAGFGESQPVASNTTDDGRQQNRRVQVRIISSGN